MFKAEGLKCITKNEKFAKFLPRKGALGGMKMNYSKHVHELRKRLRVGKEPSADAIT